MLTAAALRRFYFYYMFALEWDKSLLPQAPNPNPQHHAAQQGVVNGRPHDAHPYEQTSVNLTADQPVRPHSAPAEF